MTVNERFKNIINELYFNNKRSFANAIGVNPTVIENIVGKRGGNPSFEVVQKVLSANANISADWLIMGTGSMLRDEKIEEIKELLIPIVDNSSIGFILNRYEALAAENALLKRENEELKQSRGKHTNTPPYSLTEKVSQLAAEPRAHKHTR
jgi:transcriptional regulator with XRE-family HTH domain